MKKKVNVFGKKLPVFVILLIGMAVMVSAALIPYWGTITGSVIIGQGLFLDSLPWDDETIEYDATLTSLEEKTVSSGLHYLKNTADVDAEFGLVTTCKDSSTGDCDSSVITNVEYLLDSSLIPFDPTDWYTKLTTEFEEGMEVVTIILPEGTTLASLGDITFEESSVSGYPVSVNILLDMNNDGIFESRKDLRTGDLDLTGESVDDVLKIESAYNGGVSGAWTSVDSISGATNAWLYSAQPGAAGIVKYTLTEWITGQSNLDKCYHTTTQWDEINCGTISVIGTTPVYGIQIESLGWIEASSSVVSDIVIDGTDYEMSGLPAGEQTDFQIVTDFPKMMLPDIYTITTTVTA